MDDIERRARELLSVKYEERGHLEDAESLRSDDKQWWDVELAVSAIIAALSAAPQVPEDVMRDAERWRYLKNECTDHYGDGQSEPMEAHLCLEWGQGAWIRDGSNGGRGRPDTFPGWDAIVDEMIARTADELADLENDLAAKPEPPK